MLSRLREACQTARYTEEALRKRLGEWTPAPGTEAVERLLLEGDDRLATLARLLLLGLPTGLKEAATAVAPATLDELFAAGFLVTRAGEVWAPFSTAPHEDRLIVSDQRQTAHPEADVVIGVNPSAVTTARLTPRRRVRSTLDLGTGGGIQALAAAAHSDHVLGVDVNPRALAFAELNACLNGVANVDWAEGSWLEPVEGRLFDLIVANPPYVISPDSDYLYRDSGQSPAALARELTTALPAYLEEGGLAQVMLNWDHPRDGDWAEPLRGWVADRGCDALILRLGVDDPIAYSAAWNSPLLRSGAGPFEEALERWVSHHRELGIEAIAWGAVVLRRRSDGRNWVHALDVGAGPSGPAGEHLMRLFDTHDRLAELNDERELLDEVFALVPGHRIDQTLTYPDGRYHSHPATVRVSPGLEIRARIDPDALEVLFDCDGERPLRELLRDDGVGAHTVCSAARELLSAGLLERR